MTWLDSCEATSRFDRATTPNPSPNGPVVGAGRLCRTSSRSCVMMGVCRVGCGPTLLPTPLLRTAVEKSVANAGGLTVLNIQCGRTRDCEGVSRRHAIQVGTLAGLGISLPKMLRAESAVGRTETNCILIWTRGGTSHHDTFDPKPSAPTSVRGEFSVIPTATPGINFTEIVPRMAQEQKRFALLRGWNPQNGSHGTADQFVMSGRKFNQSVHYPCYGSVTSYPSWIQIGAASLRATGHASRSSFRWRIGGYSGVGARSL